MRTPAVLLFLTAFCLPVEGQAVPSLVEALVQKIDAVGAQDWAGPGGVIRKVLDALEGKKDRHPNKDLKVVLANFTYGQTGLGSSFSRFLEDQFSAALVQSRYFSLFPRDVLTNLPPGMAGAYRTQLGGGAATGSLSGKFFPAQGGGVIVDFQLADLGEGRVIGYGQVLVRSEWIPPSVTVDPPSVPGTLVTAAPAPGALALVLTTDRGVSGTYFDQEELTLSVFATKDCWLKVYQIDGRGTFKLIFPNPYSPSSRLTANALVRIPDGKAGFAFKLGPPYGVETLRAVASTAPFLDNETAFESLGSDAPQVLVRGLAVQPEAGAAERAEAQVRYTVLPAP